MPVDKDADMQTYLSTDRFVVTLSPPGGKIAPVPVAAPALTPSGASALAVSGHGDLSALLRSSEALTLGRATNKADSDALMLEEAAKFREKQKALPKKTAKHSVKKAGSKAAQAETAVKKAGTEADQAETPPKAADTAVVKTATKGRKRASPKTAAHWKDKRDKSNKAKDERASKGRKKASAGSASAGVALVARAEVADSSSDDSHSKTPIIATHEAADLADAAVLASTALVVAEASVLTLMGAATSDAEEGFEGTYRHFPPNPIHQRSIYQVWPCPNCWGAGLPIPIRRAVEQKIGLI
jgi:hypothetical protein